MYPQPTLAGFQDFITNVMAIKTADLPLSDPVIPFAFSLALAIVNPALRAVPIPQRDAAGVQLNTGGYSIYSMAVYNLAADNLINFAQDQDGSCFFEAMRTKLNINGFTSGVISASGDEGTNQTLVVQEAAKAFTLANLQQLKTVWGRRYLSLAQSYGPNAWGVS